MVSLILGTLLACSSSSWVMAWVGLEINLISFAPILINNLKSTSLEITIKYFLVQAMASLVVVVFAVLSFLNLNSSILIDQNTILLIRLAIKTGVAPFHFWFPQVIDYANWTQALLIITWQKIAPIILISFIINFFTFFIVIRSALIGILGGLNQTSLKKILTYSSIIHSAWIISIIFIRDIIWWQYFLIYSFLTISVVTPISLSNFHSISDINTVKINAITKIIIFINLLSLAGLPPFLGFAAKIISINAIIFSHFRLITLSVLILASLVAFYFYARLIYSSILIYQGSSNLISQPLEIIKPLSFYLLLSFIGNITISLVVLLN